MEQGTMTKDAKKHRWSDYVENNAHVCLDCGARWIAGLEPRGCSGPPVSESAMTQPEARQEKETRSAIDALFDAYNRLKLAGWNDAMYCPKDGTVFEVIEAGSTGIHECHYAGEWPNGVYWVHGPNDLWPSRPILFRLKRKAQP